MYLFVLFVCLVYFVVWIVDGNLLILIEYVIIMLNLVCFNMFLSNMFEINKILDILY